MTTPDTPTPHRATEKQWNTVRTDVENPGYPPDVDDLCLGSCILELRDTLSLTREALAALEQRVGALEELTTTALADVADAFERAAQQITPAAAPSPPSGSLVEVVAEALRLNEGSYNVVRTYILRTSDARAAIAAIAEELHRRGDRGVAAWLEREAGR